MLRSLAMEDEGKNMNNMDKVNLLKSFSLFLHLQEEDLLDVANELEDEVFPVGANIVNQGDYGDKIYFVLDGMAEAYLINKQGQEVTLGTLSKGNYFGELALLARGRRNCFVVAKTTCKLVSLSFDNFNKLIVTHSKIKDELIQLLIKRLGEALHVVSEKQKNKIILMIYSDEAVNRVQHFENYFQKISEKSVVILDGNDFQDEVKETINHIHSSYLLIKIKGTPSSFLLEKSDYVINFVHHSENGFSLTKDASAWKIENTARRITKKTIGIALCSGGMPAIAHIGVLNILQKEGIPLDYIVGTSAGAVVGGAFAFQGSTEKMLQQIDGYLAQSGLPRFLMLLSHMAFNFSGIYKPTLLRTAFRPLFEEKKMEDALIPFASVASDLFTGKTVVIDSGSALEGIVASNAAPIFSSPVKIDEHLLIDGIATAPLPIQVLIDKKIDIKIAVPIPQLDLQVPMKSNSKLPTIYIRSRSMMAEKITHESAIRADVIIRPDVAGIHMNDSTKIQSVIRAGEVAAHIAVNRIKYLLYSHHKEV